MKKFLMCFLTVVAVFCLLKPSNIKAEVIYKKIQINVKMGENVIEKATDLQLYADEDISLAYKKGTDMNIRFTENDDGTFYANVLLPVGYKYVLKGKSSICDVDTSPYGNTDDDVVISVTLKENAVYSEQTVFSVDKTNQDTDKNNNNENNAIKLSHDTSASAAATGDTVSYTLKELYNQSGEIADNFSFHVTLPAGSCLSSIYTGTYTKDATLAFIYKTKNHAEWKIGNENISALNAVTIRAQDLALEEGDYITEFTFSAETVPSGFAMKQDDPLKYNVKVLSSEEGKTLNIQTALSSYIKKEKSYTSNGTSTTVMNGVQTGDGNVLMVVSLIGLILSVVGLIGYVVYIIVSKKPKKGEDISFRKQQSKDTHGKSLKDFM